MITVEIFNEEAEIDIYEKIQKLIDKEIKKYPDTVYSAGRWKRVNTKTERT